MSLEQKIDSAHRVIDLVLANYSKPCVMWSSGKDSQVLLFMLRAHNCLCPVVFHREPFQNERYEFAERIIRSWELKVYDWPPYSVTVTKNNGHLSFIQHYQVGAGKFCALPLDIYQAEKFGDNHFVCGLQDVLYRPRGTFDYPWDVAFHGHKSSDVDPLFGAIPLHVDIKQNVGAPAYAFPLREWTDADVWKYSRLYHVPQQETRYDVETGTENENKRLNPDWFSGCTRCLDRDEDDTVFCPKLRMQVNNLAKSGQVPYSDVPTLDYCGTKGDK